MRDYYNVETREAFRKKLVDAFRKVGFVAITNTGVNQGVIDQAYQGLVRYSKPLLTAIAESISQKSDFLTKMTEHGDVSLRAIHYPATQLKENKEAVWTAEHTAINLITILPRATAEGLEVLDNEGNWICVKVPKDAFIINSGDQLTNLTNGYFRSSVHRVVASADNQVGDRYSIVMFVHPKNKDDLTPLASCIEKTGGVAKYPRANRLELLAERLADINQASPQLLEILADSGLLERMIDLDCASLDVMALLAQHNLASKKIMKELE